jgi:hypothetical protein
VEAVLLSAGHSATSPKAQVPASADYPELAGARFNNFNNYVVRTPDGTHLMAVPGLDTTSPTTPALTGTTDQALILLTVGNAVSASVAAHEGVAVVDTGRVLGLSAGLPAPSINNFLQWTIATRTHVPGATQYTATADVAGNNPDRLVAYDPTAPAGSRFTVIARAGQSAESAFGAGTGALWGTTTGSTMVFNYPSISQTGVVSFPAKPVSDGTFSNLSGIIGGSGTSVLAVSGTTVPTGQLGGATDPLLSIDQGTPSNYGASADGLHRIFRGTLNNAAQDVVAVKDGAVVLQKGMTLGTLAGTVSAITQVTMEPNGDWYARGTNTSGSTTQAWVVRNGAVLAAQGDPLFPGSTETWKSFADAHGDNAGRTVLNGTVNGAASTAVDEVLVLAGVRVLAREGDPVDVDSDGAADAGFFLGTIADRGAIGADLRYYVPARLKTTSTGTAGVGGSTASSLLRVRMCWADFNDNGQVELLDIFAFLNGWFAGNPKADYNRANGVDLLDIFAFLHDWFGGC